MASKRTLGEILTFAPKVEEESDFEDDKIKPVTPADFGILEDRLEEILVAFGWDMTNPSIEGTPKRFLKYFAEYHNEWDPAEILGTPFASPDNGMIIQGNIPFRSVCEHHLLPALGKAAVGYIPKDTVIGLSKIARLVEAAGTEKPSLQEHIGEKIASTLNNYLEPRGVMVVITAVHTCMACRGVNMPDVPTTTSVTKGAFLDNAAARQEFLALMRGL